ncbi:zinc finger CCCH domain-containing protein 13 [Microdochium nivale]|nr:zinc finger CCCH domain-containing protein 13 [Microdochium nivale]
MAVADTSDNEATTPTTPSTASQDDSGAPPSTTPKQPPQASPLKQQPSHPMGATTNSDHTAFQYGPMFEVNKTPSAQLTALLEAIAIYIIENIGSKSVTDLTPKKLAAFYHAAGGDYDSLFVHAPDKSISYIWQALGVQHILVQPDEFQPPTVPALTIRGFVRWESLQILLGPEEHVPFMQFAVRNWALKHPSTGALFPPELPANIFPSVCDPEIDKWHRECATKLRQQAHSSDEDLHQEPKRPIPRDPRINSAYSHVRGGDRPSPSAHRPEHEYFNRERTSAYTHVPPAARYPSQDYHARRSVDERRTTNQAPEDVQRRRSYSDLQSPTEPSKGETRPYPSVPDRPTPRRPPPPKHQNASRQHVTPDSDSEEELVMPRHGPQARTYGPTHPIPPPATVRRVPHGPVPPQVVPMRQRRSEARSADDTQRRSLRSEIGNKFASFLPGSADRFRSSSRDKHPAPVIVPPHPRSGKPSPTSRRGRSASDDSSSTDSQASSVLRRRRAAERERSKDHKDRDRERDRQRDRDRERDRERERERERKRDGERPRERHDEREYRTQKDSFHLRPNMDRRPSSHNDIDRRTPRDAGWDPRDRGRNADREYPSRRILTSDERAQQERDRRRYKDRVSPSRDDSPPPITTGVHGRRYPQEPRYG